MNIEIKQIGITRTNCEAVVNAANEYLLQGGGVCGYIFNAAGSLELTKACNKIGYCEVGKAVLTDGFKLSKYIIHAVGPRYIDGKHNEAKLLESAYETSLKLALDNNIKSVAFPLISAGIFGYPINEAIKIAIDTCLKFKDEDIDIVFTVPEDDKYELMLKYFNEVVYETN